jgi:hypothetical protein
MPVEIDPSFRTPGRFWPRNELELDSRGVLVVAPLLGNRTHALRVRATARGRRYMSRKPRNVTA